MRGRFAGRLTSDDLDVDGLWGIDGAWGAGAEGEEGRGSSSVSSTDRGRFRDSSIV